MGQDLNVLPIQLSDYEVYREEEAYQFLLEVVCGLHSPLLGETEVLGQFREFIKAHNEDFPQNLREILLQIAKDAKKIRYNHLQNLGCHSYGSLIRKKLTRDSMKIQFIGAGQIVEEILPWLKKQNHKIDVFTRSPKKHEGLAKEYGVSLKSLESLNRESYDIVIVAVPLSSVELNPIIEKASAEMVFDLRGESSEDKISHSKFYTLRELFADIQSFQDRAVALKKTAVNEIQSLAQQKLMSEKPRPFGWDDLWA